MGYRVRKRLAQDRQRKAVQLVAAETDDHDVRADLLKHAGCGLLHLARQGACDCVPLVFRRDCIVSIPKYLDVCLAERALRLRQQVKSSRDGESSSGPVLASQSMFGQAFGQLGGPAVSRSEPLQILLVGVFQRCVERGCLEPGERVTCDELRQLGPQ